MATRYFTVEEANQMVPQLAAAFERLIQLRVQMGGVYARLEAAGFAPVGEDFPLSVEGATRAVVSDRAALLALISAFRDENDALESQGCVLKGFEPGLVDWHARVAGREVLLCWRFGEKSVGWWHEVDAGFAGRRPIADLMELEASGEDSR
ncbi:MAG: DUF2203 domain-containing protein [Deltaproteobacteria bacterium]|nr:DUF2203 domain-containing protein [Deltaproteobacteria bacterium]